MQNENQKLIDLMKSLEIFIGQEIQALHIQWQKDLNRLRNLSELISKERKYRQFCITSTSQN